MKKPRFAPSDLVSCRQIAEYYGVSLAVPQGWRDRGRLKAVKKGANKTQLFRWSDVLALDFKPGYLDFGYSKSRCPKGHLTCLEAGAILKFSEPYVRTLCNRGVLRCATVRCPGIRQKVMSFPCRQAVLRYRKRQEDRKALAQKRQEAQTKARRKPQECPGGPIAPSVGIISADDYECLEARRRLWHEKGRIMPTR